MAGFGVGTIIILGIIIGLVIYFGNPRCKACAAMLNPKGGTFAKKCHACGTDQ